MIEINFRYENAFFDVLFEEESTGNESSSDLTEETRILGSTPDFFSLELYLCSRLLEHFRYIVYLRVNFLLLWIFLQLGAEVDLLLVLAAGRCAAGPAACAPHGRVCQRVVLALLHPDTPLFSGGRDLPDHPAVHRRLRGLHRVLRLLLRHDGRGGVRPRGARPLHPPPRQPLFYVLPVRGRLRIPGIRRPPLHVLPVLLFQLRGGVRGGVLPQPASASPTRGVWRVHDPHLTA